MTSQDQSVQTQKKNTSASRDASLKYWEKRIPEMGSPIMDLVQPFYGWRPSLQPALPDLEARLRKAIYWCKFKDIRVFHKNQNGPLRSALRAALLATYWDALSISLGDILRSTLNDTTRDTMVIALKDILSTAYWNAVGGSSGGALRIVVKDSIFYAIGLVIAKEQAEADKFLPLFDLLFAGNFPVGFDKDNNLLIIVA